MFLSSSASKSHFVTHKIIEAKSWKWLTSAFGPELRLGSLFDGHVFHLVSSQCTCSLEIIQIQTMIQLNFFLTADLMIYVSIRWFVCIKIFSFL